MDVFSGLDGKLPDGPDACLLLILGRFDVELAARQSAPLCPRQLLAEVQRLGFLALGVEDERDMRGWFIRGQRVELRNKEERREAI